MKKIFAFLMISVLLFTVCVTLFSCSSAKVNPISFGKKYMYDDDRYYVFNSNGTGYYECHYLYESSVDSTYNYVLSGRVEFEWREASDGAIYLFDTKVSYNEDHTEGQNISVIQAPIYFADEFFTYTSHNQFGASTQRYLKEGSKLEKALEYQKD